MYVNSASKQCPAAHTCILLILPLGMLHIYRHIDLQSFCPCFTTPPSIDNKSFLAIRDIALSERCNNSGSHLSQVVQIANTVIGRSNCERVSSVQLAAGCEWPSILRLCAIDDISDALDCQLRQKCLSDFFSCSYVCMTRYYKRHVLKASSAILAS